MALRFSIGKIRLKGFSFPKFGVRGSLFAAFAVIAGMAIVISAGAGLMPVSYTHLTLPTNREV